jgi:hypothetical protein
MFSPADARTAPLMMMSRHNTAPRQSCRCHKCHPVGMSLSEMSSGWLVTPNRLMLLLTCMDCFQIGLSDN